MLLAENTSSLAGVQRTDAKTGRQKGQLNGATRQASERWPRHLLSGLIICGECERKFHVSGKISQYMACPGYALGECSCRTTLRREIAESLILSEIIARLAATPSMVSELVHAAQTSWHEVNATRPAELLALDQKLAEINRRIERLIDRCELEDSANLAKRLASRCVERDVLQQKLAILKSASPEASAPPTEEWVVGQLSEIRAVLSNAGPAAHAALRGLLDGRITANEIKTPGKRRYFHRLTLQLRLHVAISADAVSGHADLDCGSCRIAFDVREPHRYETLAEDIKADFDRGLSIGEIEVKYGCSYTVVDKAMKHWHEVHGVPRPDGRSLRKRLPRKRACDRRMDEILELWQQDLPVTEIAGCLDCGMETIRAAVVTWHESHGLPIPDGRERRKQLRLAR